MGIIAEYLVNGAAPATVGGAGATIKYFADLPGVNVWNTSAPGVNSASTSNQRGLVPSSSSNNGGLLVPGFSKLNGQPFRVSAAGAYTFGTEASTDCKVGIYLSNVGPGVAPAYQTLVELDSAASGDLFAGQYHAFNLIADLEGDTLSGQLQIVKEGQIDGVYTARTSVTALTGINFAVEPAFTLVVGVTFGSSNAANLANLYKFAVELQ